MNVLEVLQEQMASANLDIALDSLQEAIKIKPRGDYRKHISRLNFLTRDIHDGVWNDYISSERVKKEIIPLFKQVYKQFKDQHYQENIKLRLMNIRRYARGLPQILPEKYIPKETKKRLSPEMIEQLSS